ncbi:MAG: 23S rRNA (guanosine(2251)-2'-O)-methyltransferase RlmB [Magnetococcus sp. DMHC-6]
MNMEAKEQEEGLIFGLTPALALLEDKEQPIEGVSIRMGGGGRLEEVIRLAKERRIPFRFVDRRTLDRLSGNGVHQGVVVRAGLRRQPGWEEILTRLELSPTPPVLVLLDGVEDPRNLGAVLRSAEGFGVLAVVMQKDRTAPLTASAMKSSAGSGQRVDLVRVTNLVRAMGQLKEGGMRLYGLAGEAETPLQKGDFSQPTGLVLGGEGKGLRRLVRETCDELFSIPMVGQGASLNVAVATGIALYEVRRGRPFFNS